MRTTQSEDRLLSWVELREQNKNNDLESALFAINNWWQYLPISNHYLHWDDETNWPDPWDLVADGVFCDLTKAVGIVYTIHLLRRQDLHCMFLAQTAEGDNLVLINDKKYILNHAPELITPDLITEIVRTRDVTVVINKID